MGKNVNIVRNGAVTSVDEETAGRLVSAGEARYETDRESQGAAVGAANAERASGIGQGAKAVLEGAADTLTGGAYGKIAGAISDDYAEDFQNRAQNRPGARLLGELATLAAPTGLFGKGAKAVSEASAIGLTEKLGATVAERTGSKVAGRIVEGGAFGLQGQMAASNVTGDPLSIEGAIEQAGVGALLNYGFGLAGDALTGVGKRAKAALETAEAGKKQLSFIAEGEGIFGKDTGAYDAFRDAHNSAKKAAEQSNRAARREAEAYSKYENPETAPGLIGKGVDQVKAAQQELRQQIAETAYGKEIGRAERAHRGAVKAYERDQKAYDSFVNSTEDVPKALKGTKDRLDNGESIGAIGEQAPPSLAARIKDFKAQRSRATKMLGGKWDPKVEGRWERSADTVADVDGAMAELHDLRNKLASDFPSVKVPDLPPVPKAPGEFVAPHGDINDVVTTAQLAQMSRDLDATARKAKELAGAGNYREAVNELQAAAARARENGFGDLVFPKFPAPPRALTEVAEKAPKSLREFASKNDVAKMAAAVDTMPAEVGEAWTRLMDDLSLKPVGSHADNVKATWDRLNAYSKAAADAKASVMSKAAASGDLGILSRIGDAARGGFQRGVSRLADSGGIAGSVNRSLVGMTIGSMMNGVEGAAIGAAVFSGKTGIRDRITQLAAKVGPRSGSLMRGLGPVTSYLHASFPSGDADKEKDSRKAAVSRIREIMTAAHAAPDTAYLLVQPLMGHPGDVAWKVHQQLVGAVQYLAAMAPKDPGLDLRLQGSNWSPSHAQTLEFAHRIEAVVDPLSSIARTIAGDGHPAAAEALWHVWPAMMQEHAQEFLAMDRNQLTYEQESVAARLLGVETGLREPAVVASLQGLYLPTPTQPQSGGTGGSPGRPAAVRSPVAGSSVSALIS